MWLIRYVSPHIMSRRSNGMELKEGQCELNFYDLQEKIIPAVKLCSDFEICTWKNGDEHRWFEIVKEAFGEDMSNWSAEKFVERYASSPLFKADGFFFIRHNKRYVATAFAWQEKTNSSEGRLHWLAVLPKYGRRGLGRALALHVLHYHKDHGKQSVSLKTEICRHSAIKLYKDIGFVCVAKET